MPVPIIANFSDQTLYNDDLLLYEDVQFFFIINAKYMCDDAMHCKHQYDVIKFQYLFDKILCHVS